MFSRENPVIEWLLGNNNPAVAYRTKTELLNEHADKEPVIAWLTGFLPRDWMDTKGLWSTYWLTAIAECGLTYNDIDADASKVDSFYDEHKFECGCGDFMRLRAMVRLGLEIPQTLIESMRESQLPDGGFLCLHRLDKLKYTPKSCAKVNMHALMFCAEYKKRGIRLGFEERLISYFWNHQLFYRTDNPEMLMLDGRIGWRTIDTFYPSEVMRIGLQNIVEAFCALGYGNDIRLEKAWAFLNERKTEDNKYLLDGSLSKSYLRKEPCGKPSKWVTFYALLAHQEKTNLLSAEVL